MNRSETIGALAKALAAAQAEMRPAKKGAENPFYKSSYADLPSVVEAAKPLARHGLSYVQATDFAETGAWVETMLMHESGEWISGRYPVNPVKNDPQGLGSALTYSRRYGLAALIGVVAADEDDDGNAASHTNGRQAHPIEQQTNGGSAPLKVDPKLLAAKWAKDAEAAIKACADHKELTEWEDKNKNSMVKLHSVDLKAHERLMELIQDRYERLNPLAA